MHGDRRERFAGRQEPGRAVAGMSRRREQGEAEQDAATMNRRGKERCRLFFILSPPEDRNYHQIFCYRDR